MNRKTKKSSGLAKGIFYTGEEKSLNFFPKTVMCIGAHPDDIEIHAGGAISKLQELFSCAVHFVVVTDGSKGTWVHRIKMKELAKKRAQEQKKASQLLNIEGLHMLNFREGEVLNSLDSLKIKLVSLVRKIKPDIVMTHDPYKLYEFHSDHLIVSKIAAEASLIMAANYGYFPELTDKKNLAPHFVPLLLLFDTNHPNFAITFQKNHVQQKLEAIKLHHSQFGNRPKELQKFKKIMKKSGKKFGCQYAEFFHLIINR